MKMAAPTARPHSPKSPTSKPLNLPPSATRGWIVAAGALAWAGCLWLVRYLHFQNAVQATVVCMGAMAAVNFALDSLCLRIYAAPSTGLDWAQFRPSLHRTAIKLVGLLASFGFIGGLFWLFPEYHGAFYDELMELVRLYLPWWLVLSVAYIYVIDSRQKDPKDGYYAAGMACTLQFDKVNPSVLWQHCLAWLVKGYFIALMFTYYARDTRTFIGYDFSRIHNFRAFYEFMYYFVFLADTGLACAGYILTLRLFDTHVRRTEPTFKGWTVALMCYQPFWSLLSASYFDYSRDFAWGPWLDKNPALYAVWGSTILLLLLIYLWATIMFGCRFSNLTHRGILTNGPYRWTKHPAYLSKNLAYWMIYVPFIVSQSPADSIRRCALLGFVNYIYYLRAKTEEANLGTDPAYVQYASWIRPHGLLRWLRRPSSSTPNS